MTALQNPVRAMLHAAHIQRRARMAETKYSPLAMIPTFEPPPPLVVEPAPPREPEILDKVEDNPVLRVIVERKQVRAIIREMAAHFNLPAMELISARRTKSVVKPRQTAMFVCIRYTGRSYPYVGRQFGGRDHTTVIHAVRKVARLIEDGDLETIEAVAAVVKKLEIKNDFF